MSTSNTLHVSFEPGSAVYKRLGSNFAYGIPREKCAALRNGLQTVAAMLPTLGASCKAIIEIIVDGRQNDYVYLEVLRDVNFNANGRGVVADCDSGRLLALLAGYLIGGDGESFAALAFSLPEHGIQVKLTNEADSIVMEIFGESIELRLVEVN